MINPKELTFGRNETFFLRYGWIAKGLRAYQENPKIFNEQDSPLKLGVGKNMVSSIKYWLRAYDIVAADGSVTKFGHKIFDSAEGIDPYTEDETTQWLLHWKLCKNPSEGTLYFWFFNIFKKANFTLSQLEKDLDEWLQKYDKRVSANTLKRDRGLLLRTYLSKSSDEISPEDFLDNPFSNLNLINLSRDERTYSCPVKLRSGISPELVGFCLADLQSENDLSRVPLDFFIDEKDQISLTGIFKIDRDNLTILIEELAIKFPDFISIEDGIEGKSVIFQKSYDPFYFLEDRSS